MDYLGIIGTLAIIYLFYILARLSERLGSVERMEPLYRYYYVAAAFVSLGLITQITVAQASLSPQNGFSWILSDWFAMALYYLPMSIGVTIGAGVTWRYWSWLISHLEK
jgi:hypothetical protein